MEHIKKVLPHRFPFLMIDGIEEMEQGKSVKGYKNISHNDYYINKIDGTFPNTLVVEALAQLGAFASTTEQTGLGFLSSLKGVTFTRCAKAGDRIDLYYEVLRNKRGFVLGRGTAKAGSETIVTVEEILIYQAPQT
ncbi:3-hydroxyacyl-ACP dehydratase FabZ family protein [Metabacillus fastidiosus]|uniref:3-hydroxyacyl-ACP dehydratase FabZ family protein n=1 Tax=Metabacillus fastidiosus TaxID=1458 RepID=UPI002DB6EDBA|nr:3-hydroxyacyl-ACP dehydratase FabZ family protein [Metabacillus fastidiosus]MEC2075467.1 beta-hydroxyacyl-ACP dehydratase [Metabacillus fastidiosus]